MGEWKYNDTEDWKVLQSMKMATKDASDAAGQTKESQLKVLKVSQQQSLSQHTAASYPSDICQTSVRQENSKVSGSFNRQSINLIGLQSQCLGTVLHRNTC